jgi:5,10-methylene-tetrahydrofolate dehydrogenase/methenyl tetrahydrofolate cyclohydrolase
MPAQLIDGIALSQKLRSEIATRAALTAKGKQPGLAVILVGDDPASGVCAQQGQGLRRRGFTRAGKIWPT